MMQDKIKRLPVYEIDIDQIYHSPNVKRVVMNGKMVLMYAPKEKAVPVLQYENGRQE